MSQRTIPLPSGHPLQAMTGLSRQIALPHEFAPLRFPSFPALERTALMGFSVPTTLQVPAVTAVKVGLCRQAAYPCWAEQAYTLGSYSTTYATDAFGVSSAGGQVDWTAVFRNTISSFAGNSVASTSVVGITGSNNVLPRPIMGFDGATGCVPFMYCPSGFNTYFTIGYAPGALVAIATYNVTFERWVSPGNTVTFSLSGTITAGNLANNALISIQSNVWIRPVSVDIGVPSALVFNRTAFLTLTTSAGVGTYSPSGATQGSINFLASSGNTGFLPLVYPSEFANSTLPWYATRTTAASVLITNVSQVLNKGGTVLAGRVSPNVVDMFTVDQAYLNNLHPAEKGFMALETGHYTYCPPSTDLSNFWDYTTTTTPIGTPLPNYNQPNVQPYFRLDNDSLYNVCYLTATAVAETFAVTVDWHIEFRTSSTLFQIGLCTLTLESLHQAQIALAAVGYFFENPNHKPILNQVINAAKKYGPSALAMVPHPAAKAVAMMMSSAPRRPPPTTSASGSGIIPKKPGKGKKPPPKGKGKKRK